MHTIPIDFDRSMYTRARDAIVPGGTDEKLFEDYFDSQLAMLQALKPPVVGHFDLIRLKSDDPERSFTQWPAVWEKILRNLDFIAEYGAILELNSASLRKGLSEPYPKAEICRVCQRILLLLLLHPPELNLSDPAQHSNPESLGIPRPKRTILSIG